MLEIEGTYFKIDRFEETTMNNTIDALTSCDGRVINKPLILMGVNNIYQIIFTFSKKNYR
jgi:hypothetical protein